MEKVYLAVDLGASSGRVIAGIYDGKKLSLEEVNRFDNNSVVLDSGIYWKADELYENITEGLKAAVRRWRL